MVIRVRWVRLDQNISSMSWIAFHHKKTEGFTGDKFETSGAILDDGYYPSPTDRGMCLSRYLDIEKIMKVEKSYNSMLQLDIKKPTATIGDINENVLESSKFERFMRGKGFFQMMDKPTHESGSLLDHIYINDALDQMGFFTQSEVCYYSDHDIVSLFVSK